MNGTPDYQQTDSHIDPGMSASPDPSSNPKTRADLEPSDGNDQGQGTVNIYYDPEKFGLTTVGEVEMSSGSYEFDLFVVWRDNHTGDFLWGQDSGCSCPSPFELTGLGDLTRGTAHEAAAAIQAVLAERPRYYDEQTMYGDAEAVDLIGKIMAAPSDQGGAS